MLNINLNEKIFNSELTVSQFSAKVRDLLEENFSYVKIKGEISGLKIASSGHAYFNLKEQTNILACTCWRPILAKIPFELKDGLEIVVSGKITAYSGQSRYQISAQMITPSGVGVMMKILQERKIKLEQEGLFNPALKKKLPFMPGRIGIITSITGAVIKDMIHRIEDRCPTHIIIWPVVVQGETAPIEIIKAIDGFNALDPNIRPQVLIVARGGGSIEDLWAFNDEEIVRAVARSHIPIISAVGHETDFTLIDYAADLRAPTPTAAAEFAVPVLTSIQYNLESNFFHLQKTILSNLKFYKQTLSSFDEISKYSDRYLASKQQRFDEAEIKLINTKSNILIHHQHKIDQISQTTPLKLWQMKNMQKNHSYHQLLSSINQKFSHCQYKYNLKTTLLNSLDYNSVLKRGFAIVKNEQDRIITNPADLKKNEFIKIKFANGEEKVRIQN